MLDTPTKRRIDTARDILVGKVPDPKSQVEQITIALIYKFMDDMDAESEELGGKRKFFTNEFARYGWGKLMSPALGGHEMLGLYAEGITKMPENPGIPPLFRDIFKNAYLPYRDPETLKAFLKIIDEFSYDHSERLGDAFEYLLSVLGSQGDAGQFRTPRNIIDFMVEIVDPKKNETILDPACGTAGFLISSYKHIIKANIDHKGQNFLTPDEKGRLARNIKGYDISPDMVRLSLVNLYLHEFTDPHIYEYDTLTSVERWSEYADVILANPPFMSPKGGIKPHRRFSIQAKRSEVLFVDYMAEHLTPTGRAGIIVPEGIIFQSQGAYRDLRKMLVENSLVAVISLPAGCFNPYSGVKTSILILDKSLARQSDTIAFFKVENDGFGLGAQRREIEKNDLPQVQVEIAEYMRRLRMLESVDDFQPTLGLIVPKEKIAANGDFNLSVERYRENGRLSRAKWPIVPLGEFCNFMTGGTPASTVAEYYEGGTVPWLVSGDIHKSEIWDCERRITEKGVQNSNARYLPEDSILIALNGQGKTRGTVAMLRMKATCNQSLVAITPNDSGRAVSEYVFWTLRSMYEDIRAVTGDNERSGLSIAILKTIMIPLPPLEVQKEIVTEIEGYKKVIDGAITVLNNYRPHIPIRPSWHKISLGEISTFKNGLNFERGSSGYRVKIIGVGDFKDRLYAPMSDLEEVNLDRPLADDYLVRDGDILFVRSNGNPDLVGRSLFVSTPVESTTFSGFTIRCRIMDHRAFPLFYAHFFKSRDFAEMIKKVGQGANIRNLSQGMLNELEIPLPPLREQQLIVTEIEAEQSLVDANRELISCFEKKIQATLTRIWGKEELDLMEV